MEGYAAHAGLCDSEGASNGRWLVIVGFDDELHTYPHAVCPTEVLLGDGHQRVPFAELEEGPRTTAVLGRYSAPSTNRARIGAAGFERQDLLHADVALPTVNEVVLVQEPLLEAEPEGGEAYTARVDEAFATMLSSVDDEAMQVLVAPAEGDL